MAVNYSPSEVFRMAEQIERNGCRFYIQAAEAVRDASTKNIFRDLAQKEKRHEEIFAQLRQKYCQTADIHFVDIDGQAQAYIQSAADVHVFNLDQDVTKLLASVQSPQSTLRLAIQFEKDTIAFFTALKKAVSPENQEKVDLLIQEEIEHIHQLQQALHALGKKG